jgi:hypothetical protein
VTPTAIAVAAGLSLLVVSAPSTLSHEGNYSIVGMRRGARAQEREQAAAGTPDAGRRAVSGPPSTDGRNR